MHKKPIDLAKAMAEIIALRAIVEKAQQPSERKRSVRMVMHRVRKTPRLGLSADNGKIRPRDG